MTEPAVTATGPEHIDMSNPVEIDLAELGKAWRYTEGAKHAWVIAAVYSLEDPEQALDDMVLGQENLVGFQPIHCLWCWCGYRAEVRPELCPGPTEWAGF